MTPPGPLEHLATVVAELECAPLDAEALSQLVDDDLLTLTTLGASVRRLLDARTALVAGELARRSHPELGHTGLAQRLGHRTVEELVRVTTGESRRDAVTAVNAGRLLVAPAIVASAVVATAVVATAVVAPGQGGAFPPAPSHLGPAISAVRAGIHSTAALEAIRTGLGEPTESITADALHAACERLVEAAGALDVDRLHRLARHLRENLDSDAIADRERAQRRARSFRLVALPDGMTRATWLLDPESAAHVRELVDRAVSPKRRTVQFSNHGDAEKAARIANDDRTTEQYASDAMLHLLISGADVDSSMMLGTGAPSVRVLVTARDLVRGAGSGSGSGSGSGASFSSGSGSFEAAVGQPDGVALSLPTVHRLMCEGTHTPILIGSTGQPLDVGRTQRLFTARQRIALSARDGGCRWPGCERPPSWCEAHHVDHWKRDGGSTDVEAGILLCRHHHLLLHDQNWSIVKAGPSAEFQLLPPVSVDPLQRPRPMPSRSREWRRALAS